MPSFPPPLLTQGHGPVFKCFEVTVVKSSNDVCPAGLVCEVLTSVFESGKLAAAGIALEKGVGVVVSALMPVPRRGLKGIVWRLIMSGPS